MLIATNINVTCIWEIHFNLIFFFVTEIFHEETQITLLYLLYYIY